MFLRFLIPVFVLISFSVAQRDPLKDFCRIHGHQTTVVNRTLYVDGGVVNWAPIEVSSTNFSSTWIRAAHLDENNQGFPNQTLLTKDSNVPSVQGGILWPDEANMMVYLYGGEYGDSSPDVFTLWFYDIVYDTWNQSDARVNDVHRAAWGAGASVQDRGLGYYYGGYLNNKSEPGYDVQTPLSSMLVYNMLENNFRNLSGPDNTPRAEGVMLYVPAGDSGLLVYFGGVEYPLRNSTNGTSTRRGLPMSEIFIYSIADDIWYQQEASGDVPEDRRRFCAGLAYPEDRSSYNIYLFGGASINEGVGYGDVYILSLPSFTWIKYWPRPEDPPGATFPHHSLTCDVIGNSQMIIQGGHFTNTSGCDLPTVQGQHGLDLGKQNADGAKWAAFNPNITSYVVPPEITSAIGGGPTGAATRTAPTGGFSERDVGIQFGRAYTEGQRDPTRPIPTPTSTSDDDDDNAAAIGGGVGGGLGGALLVAIIGFFVWRRRRRARLAANNPDTTQRPTSELPTSNMDHLKSAGQPYTSPTLSQHTPQGSPYQPSESQWSAYAAPAPQYPGSPEQHHSNVIHEAPEQERHSPRGSTYKQRLQASPVFDNDARGLHEIGATSPRPVVGGDHGLNIQPLQIPTIDPYYAQNPPTGGTPRGHFREHPDL